jgi:hypothetical protein
MRVVLETVTLFSSHSIATTVIIPSSSLSLFYFVVVVVVMALDLGTVEFAHVEEDLVKEEEDDEYVLGGEEDEGVGDDLVADGGVQTDTQKRPILHKQRQHSGHQLHSLHRPATAHNIALLQ